MKDKINTIQSKCKIKFSAICDKRHYSYRILNLNLINYIKIVRPKNLVIVAISQILIYLVYLMPQRERTSIELDGNLWILFVVDTLLIAAGGYVINDILDQKADMLNKPGKLFMGKNGISSVKGWIYYFILVIIGFAIAFYIASRIDKLLLLSIYPTAVGFLFLYSKYFKRMPLLGNLVVSLFCAFVPAIIWYAEFDMVESLHSIDPRSYKLIVNVFIAYILFAFLSTFVREVIKDIEDVEGDQKSSYQTLPIQAGIGRANVVALFFSILLLLSYGFWFTGYIGNQLVYIGLVVLLGLIIPTCIIIRQIYLAKSQIDYSSISKRLKYLMISSLFIFLCIPFMK